MSEGQLSMLPEEEAKKERVLSRMEEEPLRRYLLEKCRDYAKRLYLDRRQRLGEEAHVTADDVRRYFENELDPPDWLDRNMLGATFKTDEWEPTGDYVRSETPGSHGNLLTCWRWTGGADEAA